MSDNVVLHLHNHPDDRIERLIDHPHRPGLRRRVYPQPGDVVRAGQVFGHHHARGG